MYFCAKILIPFDNLNISLIFKFSISSINRIRQMTVHPVLFPSLDPSADACENVRKRLLN